MKKIRRAMRILFWPLTAMFTLMAWRIADTWRACSGVLTRSIAKMWMWTRAAFLCLCRQKRRLIEILVSKF